MDWNYAHGSYNFGKSFSGEGLPDSDRAWFERYELGEFRSLGEAVVGDYFYYAGLLDDVLHLKKLSLSSGQLCDEASYDQVSYSEVSADERFISAGGWVLSLGGFNKIFDRTYINPKASPEMIVDIAMAGGDAYCSRAGNSEEGVAVVRKEGATNIEYIREAEYLLAFDGVENYIFSTQSGVLFYKNSREKQVWVKPVSGYVDGIGFAGDGSFYMKVSGCVFRASRSDGPGWDVVHLCNAESSDFSDYFIYKEYVVVVSVKKMSIDVYDRFSGEHVHSHPIKVNKIVSGFMRGGIYYSNYDHHPVAYDVMSGELVWRSEDRVTTSKVIGTSKAVIYKFVGGGYQCYYMG